MTAQSLKDFLTSPFGAVLLALVTNALYDFSKIIFLKTFNAESSVKESTRSLKGILARFDNGSFIVDLLYAVGFIITFSGLSIMIAYAQTILNKAVENHPGEYQYLFQKYFCFGLLVITFTLIMYNLARVRRYWYAICHTGITLNKITKNISKIPAQDRGELNRDLHDVVELAERLKLL
ncbi:hypothetical protein ACVIRO_001072 [Rhizobium ruizarguesonis]